MLVIPVDDPWPPAWCSMALPVVVVSLNFEGGGRESMERMESAHTYLRYVKARSEGEGGGQEGGGFWGREGWFPDLGFRIGPLNLMERVVFSSRGFTRAPSSLPWAYVTPFPTPPRPRLPLFLPSVPSSRSLDSWRSLEARGRERGRCFTSREEPCRRAGHASRPCTRHRAGI